MLSLSLKIFSWHCYKQERGCLMHCERLANAQRTNRESVPNSGLSKFRRGTSIVLSMSTKLVVVVVDGRVCRRHLYDSRRVVAVYYKSVNCNLLTPLRRFDLLLICYTTGYPRESFREGLWNHRRTFVCLSITTITK